VRLLIRWVAPECEVRKLAVCGVESNAYRVLIDGRECVKLILGEKSTVLNIRDFNFVRLAAATVVVAAIYPKPRTICADSKKAS
jgi:hypothetical protein